MEHPIIFSAPMVQAILAGRKTMTRRIIKPQPATLPELDDAGPKSPRWLVYGIPTTLRCPYGAPGDRLWVRETWQSDLRNAGKKPHLIDQTEPVWFAADGKSKGHNGWGIRATGWRPSIFMPRWASRITLRVTEIRVERLHAITEDDARAEGGGLYVPGHGFITEDQLKADPGYANFLSPVMGFQSIWDSINGPGAWNANPYVWVVKFEREEKAGV